MTDRIIWIAAPALIGLGMSQLYAASWWQSYYRRLADMGERGVRLNGFVSLMIGGPIVILHNAWSGPPLLLTLIGWLLVLESALCLFLPGAGLSSMSDVEDAVRGRIIRATGVVLIVIGGVLGVHAMSAAG